jgi:hypothetical protein
VFWLLVHWWGSAESGPYSQALVFAAGTVAKSVFSFSFWSFVGSEGFGSESFVCKRSLVLLEKNDPASEFHARTPASPQHNQ